MPTIFRPRDYAGGDQHFLRPGTCGPCTIECKHLGTNHFGPNFVRCYNPVFRDFSRVTAAWSPGLLLRALNPDGRIQPPAKEVIPRNV